MQLHTRSSEEEVSPVAKPLSRLRVDADWLYACTRRCGSGIRASEVNSAPLMMSPLHPTCISTRLGRLRAYAAVCLILGVAN